MFLNLSVSRLHRGSFGMAVLCLMIGHASNLHAKDLAVFEDRINPSPPDGQGYSTVSAPAGSVIVSPDAIGTFNVENSGNKEKISGKVNPDGSFSGRIRAGAGDKLKITIMTSTDNKKRIKKKVPPQLFSSPSPRTKDTPAYARTESLPQFPDPTPEIIIRYKGAPGKGASGATGPPMNPDAEVSDSGVLPPD
jgi:hypothetical protein